MTLAILCDGCREQVDQFPSLEYRYVKHNGNTTDFHLCPVCTDAFDEWLRLRHVVHHMKQQAHHNDPSP